MLGSLGVVCPPCWSCPFWGVPFVGFASIELSLYRLCLIAFVCVLSIISIVGFISRVWTLSLSSNFRLYLRLPRNQLTRIPSTRRAPAPPRISAPASPCFSNVLMKVCFVGGGIYMWISMRTLGRLPCYTTPFYIYGDSIPHMPSFVNPSPLCPRRGDIFRLFPLDRGGKKGYSEG